MTGKFPVVHCCVNDLAVVVMCVAASLDDLDR